MYDPRKIPIVTDTSMPIFYLVKTKTRMAGSVTMLKDHTAKKHRINVTSLDLLFYLFTKYQVNNPLLTIFVKKVHINLLTV